ncbi:Tn3 family transposase [Streptomyces vinaceus]|uniref:Tn3 family transposase n=1 Tax=Streptomyces vinaceus TaxID=1960 RepID=UPI0035D8585D
MEDWNSVNHDLFYGKDGDLTGSDKEFQEVSMLALHLLQSALVHVKTLLLQGILSEEKWKKRLTEADRRVLSPLFWTRVNPYGRFELDMNSRLALVPAATAVVPAIWAHSKETVRSILKTGIMGVRRRCRSRWGCRVPSACPFATTVSWRPRMPLRQSACCRGRRLWRRGWT